MDQEKRKGLEAAGIDVQSALERFMNNETLLERFLKKFLDDPNYGKLKAAQTAGDREGAVTASHSLKGVCGNLSMTALFGLFTSQVAALREGDLAGAGRLMEEIGPAYSAVTAAIRGGTDGPG